ncbi:hypothetical protein JW890_08325 [candidate division WOR-3 bacterium]|nr:hypothetical protein [candidate division WOR-3 bacterium]
MSVSVSCPSCASPVSYLTGNKTCTCNSCGKSLKIILTGGIFSYRKNIRTPVIDRALDLAVSDSAPETSYKVIDKDVIFVPVWKASGRAVGWVSGKTLKKKIPYSVDDRQGNKRVLFRTEGGEISRRIIDSPFTFFDVDNTFFKEFFPSVDTLFADSDEGLSLFDEEKMKKSGKIYFPEKEIEEAREIFRKKMKDSALASWDPSKYSFFSSSVEIINFNLGLIFYPVLLARFLTSKYEGLVIIDCSTGKPVGRKITPVRHKKENFLSQKGLFSLAVSLAGFLAGAMISWGGIFAGAGVFAAILSFIFIFRKNYGN